MPLAANARTGMLQYYFTNTAVGSLALVRPTAWAVSLHTSSAVVAGNEVANANGYARQSLGASGLTASGDTASNAATVTFGGFTGTVSGIVAFGIWDSATYGAGNLIGFGTLVQQGTAYTCQAAGFIAGGTGYTINDVLTVAGGTFTTAAQITVTAVAAGVITGCRVSQAGAYSVSPTNPASVTGGTGSGATFDLFWQQAAATYTVNNGDSLAFAAGQLVVTQTTAFTFTPG
jgi:hypothetical protein